MNEATIKLEFFRDVFARLDSLHDFTNRNRLAKEDGVDMDFTMLKGTVLKGLDTSNNNENRNLNIQHLLEINKQYNFCNEVLLKQLCHRDFSRVFHTETNVFDRIFKKKIIYMYLYGPANQTLEKFYKCTFRSASSIQTDEEGDYVLLYNVQCPEDPWLVNNKVDDNIKIKLFAKKYKKHTSYGWSYDPNISGFTNTIETDILDDLVIGNKIDVFTENVELLKNIEIKDITKGKYNNEEVYSRTVNNKYELTIDNHNVEVSGGWRHSDLLTSWLQVPPYLKQLKVGDNIKLKKDIPLKVETSSNSRTSTSRKRSPSPQSPTSSTKRQKGGAKRARPQTIKDNIYVDFKVNAINENSITVSSLSKFKFDRFDQTNKKTKGQKNKTKVSYANGQVNIENLILDENEYGDTWKIQKYNFKEMDKISSTADEALTELSLGDVVQIYFDDGVLYKGLIFDRSEILESFDTSKYVIVNILYEDGSVNYNFKLYTDYFEVFRSAGWCNRTLKPEEWKNTNAFQKLDGLKLNDLLKVITGKMASTETDNSSNNSGSVQNNNSMENNSRSVQNNNNNASESMENTMIDRQQEKVEIFKIIELSVVEKISETVFYTRECVLLNLMNNEQKKTISLTDQYYETKHEDGWGICENDSDINISNWEKDDDDDDEEIERVKSIQKKNKVIDISSDFEKQATCFIEESLNIGYHISPKRDSKSTTIEIDNKGHYFPTNKYYNILTIESDIPNKKDPERNEKILDKIRSAQQNIITDYFSTCKNTKLLRYVVDVGDPRMTDRVQNVCSIANDWDSSPNKCRSNNKFLDKIPSNAFEMNEMNFVFYKFDPKTIIIKYKDNKNVSISWNGNDFYTIIKSITEYEALPSLGVKHMTVNSVNLLQRCMMNVLPIKSVYPKPVDGYQGYKNNDVGFALDMKRSGDSLQVIRVNQMNNDPKLACYQHIFVSIDQMAFLYCRLLNIPAILIGVNTLTLFNPQYDKQPQKGGNPDSNYTPITPNYNNPIYPVNIKFKSGAYDNFISYLKNELSLTCDDAKINIAKNFIVDILELECHYKSYDKLIKSIQKGIDIDINNLIKLSSPYCKIIEHLQTINNYDQFIIACSEFQQERLSKLNVKLEFHKIVDIISRKLSNEPSNPIDGKPEAVESLQNLLESLHIPYVPEKDYRFLYFDAPATISKCFDCSPKRMIDFVYSETKNSDSEFMFSHDEFCKYALMYYQCCKDVILESIEFENENLSQNLRDSTVKNKVYNKFHVPEKNRYAINTSQLIKPTLISAAAGGYKTYSFFRDSSVSLFKKQLRRKFIKNTFF